MVDKFIIRTSDRGSFRRCRQAWDLGSKIRLNWDYVPGVEPLDFGTAIHAALEVYYDPRRWLEDRTIVQQESIIAFSSHMNDWKKRLRRAEQWDIMEGKWKEHNILGRGMLAHFFAWAPPQDEVWEPLKVEIEFEVPIPVPDDYDLPHPFERDRHNNLVKAIPRPVPSGMIDLVPVMYQGRIDLIAKNAKSNLIYIWDHKTAGQFGDYDHYELDTQCSSYAWVLKKILGIDVAGIIFQELRKKTPEEPKQLKNGTLSKDKRQSTTADIYRNTVNRLRLPIKEYQEFIDFLEVESQQYFRRIQVDRTSRELDIIERNVLDEAIDMLNDPKIYPNPGKFNCNGCLYREPCIMRQDGSDWEYFLEHSLLYEKRG
jgi:PD-(D/E)XK nuclease superfamily protein